MEYTMSEDIINGALRVAMTTDGRGRGVFAMEDFEDGELIEICPMIVLSAEDKERLANTTVHDYYFLWEKDSSKAAIALGFGSLYNHSYDSNAEYIMNFDEQAIMICAVRHISTGEEICINYNGDVNDKSLVWFDDPQYQP